MGIDPSQYEQLQGGPPGPPDPSAGLVDPGGGQYGGDPAGGLPPGLDAAMGDPNAALQGGQMPSLDPRILAEILFQTLQKMQTDDQFAMQMQMEMAKQAMGQQQQVAAKEALAALMDQMGADGQMLTGPGDMPPPAATIGADPGADVTRQLEGMAYPA